MKAYKSVLKEKEALESSLQALSTRTNTPTRGRGLKPAHDYSSGTSDCEGGGKTGNSRHSATEDEEKEGGQQGGCVRLLCLTMCYNIVDFKQCTCSYTHVLLPLDKCYT